MLQKILSEHMYLGDYGWHTGRFHFSFGDYDDPGNTHFGELIAFNDFVVKPGFGFETHPHREIEIVSYCLKGELTHVDSMGNRNTIKRGDMQYACAGSGITHSETNRSPVDSLRFIQIWIRPNAKKLQPRYLSNHYTRRDRLNRLLHIASGNVKDDVVLVNQDTNIFVSEIQAGREVTSGLHPAHLYYLVCLEGSLDLNDLILQEGDAAKIWAESSMTMSAVEGCHSIIVESPAGN
jgi:redox-sensitive bicupin YhaK (pirin superfamily)